MTKAVGADPALAVPAKPASGLDASRCDPGDGLPMWAAGSLAAAKFELRRLEAVLGNEPLGASRVSIYAADLYALISAIEKMRTPRSTGEQQ